MANSVQVAEIQARLDSLLRSVGASKYTASEARLDAQEGWRELRAMRSSTVKSGDEPFFLFVVSTDGAVFTMFEGPRLSLYVIPVDERTFIQRFDEVALACWRST